MCVDAHMSVRVCACVHVIAHACRRTLYSPNPKEMSTNSPLLPVCIRIYIYILYILNIYLLYILNQLGLITVKMLDKIVMVTIKIRSLE